MSQAVLMAQQSVDVPVDPHRAFQLFTEGINQWWKRGTNYWNDRGRAVGLRFEPYVGGRFIEVYDAQTGEGFEIGRISVWEPGRRLVYTWRQANWAPEEITEVEVTFTLISEGTRVTVTHTGWERVRGGTEMSRGYTLGHAELLRWYAGTVSPLLRAYTIVLLTRPADAPEFSRDELEELQRRHLAFLTRMRAEGKMLVSGPLAGQPDPAWRGLCIYLASLEEAREWVEQDPAVRARRLAATVFQWMMPGELKLIPP